MEYPILEDKNVPYYKKAYATSQPKTVNISVFKRQHAVTVAVEFNEISTDFWES